MLNAQFDGDVLVLRPDGPITREDVAALTRTADEYLAGHAKISGVMVLTQKFPVNCIAPGYIQSEGAVSNSNALC